MYKEYKINNLEDTKKLAEEIADKINLGEVITLKGTLGAGKTFFTNCFINYLMKKNNLEEVEVASPTFNIVNYIYCDFGPFYDCNYIFKTIFYI